jgi:hypothetical protein
MVRWRGIPLDELTATELRRVAEEALDEAARIHHIAQPGWPFEAVATGFAGGVLVALTAVMVGATMI